MVKIDLGIYGTRDVANLKIFNGSILNFATATPLMEFDYANTVSEESTADRVYAMGAGTRRLAWDGNKERTLTVETQLFTMQHLAMMSGESIRQKASDIIRVDTLTVGADGTVTLDRTPISDDIAVLPYVNATIQRVPQTITNRTGKTITLRQTDINDVKEGSQVQVFYQWTVEDSYVLAFTDESTPPYVTIVADTFYVDEQTGDYLNAQIVYFKAKVRQESTFAYSSEGDPSSLTLTFDLFPIKIDGKSTTQTITIYKELEGDSEYVDIVYSDSRADVV